MIRLGLRPIALDRDQTNALSTDNLLTIFRIVTISRFIVALIIYFILSTTLDDRNPGRLLAMLEALLLTVYLSFGVLHRFLGERYLTIALVWGSVLPLLISSLTIYLVFTAPVPPLMQSRIGQIESVVVMSNIAQTLSALLIPLLIVSWRYARKHVILFCVGTSVLDVGILVLFVPLDMANLTIAMSMIAFRLVSLILVGLMVNFLVAERHAQAQALHDANARLRDDTAAQEHLITSQERN
ncbi:MAG: hypothetical protein OHK0046_51030 [Anaerolineae bacterium]